MLGRSQPAVTEQIRQVLGTLEADDKALGIRVLIREDLGLEMFAAVRSGS